MNNKKRWRLPTVLVLSIFFIQRVSAQTAPTDSNIYASAKNASNVYSQRIGAASHLVNGPAYFFYDRLIKGDAYFAGTDWKPANLYYDGVDYQAVPILYDVLKDLVVVQLPNKTDNYSLIGNKLLSFSFSDATFIRIGSDSANVNFKPGFYQLIYSGKCQGLSKTTKTIQNSGASSTEKFFVEDKKYYVRSNGAMYAASSEGELLKAFKSKKKELEQYIKSSKIKYRKDPERAVAQIAAYYDQLTN